MIASLPMYDWPEVRHATEALWSRLRARLGDAGFDAPRELTAPVDLWAHWRDGALLLSQTCGLPYAARLSGDVSLVGTPSYDLPGHPAGRYWSEIVVRAEDAATSVAGLKGRRFAFNARDSQSGWAGFSAAHGAPDEMFGELVETRAHRASIRAVAEGRADAASIDAVSWRLAQAHEPAASRLRVLASTTPTPGLPMITARRPAEEVERIAAAVEAGIGDLAPQHRAALGIIGLARFSPADYAPLAKGWPAAA